MFRLLCVLLLALLWLSAEAVESALPVQATQEEQSTRIILCAGQADIGFGIKESTLARQRPEMWQWMQSRSSAIRYSWRYINQRTRSSGDRIWQPLRGVTLPEVSMDERVFGEEHIIAYYLSYYYKILGTGQPVAVIKVANNDSSLLFDWTPADILQLHTAGKGLQWQGGFMYEHFREQVAASLEKMQERGEAWDVAGLFWHQGAGDVQNPEAAKRYSDLLRIFIDGGSVALPITPAQEDLGVLTQANGEQAIWAQGVRQMLGQAQHSVVAVSPHWHMSGRPDWGPRAEWEDNLIAIRSGLKEWAAEDGRTRLVSVDDMPLEQGCYHSDATLIEVAERMVQEWLDQETGGQLSLYELKALIHERDWKMHMRQRIALLRRAVRPLAVLLDEKVLPNLIEALVYSPAFPSSTVCRSALVWARHEERQRQLATVWEAAKMYVSAQPYRGESALNPAIGLAEIAFAYKRAAEEMGRRRVSQAVMKRVGRMLCDNRFGNYLKQAERVGTATTPGTVFTPMSISHEWQELEEYRTRQQVLFQRVVTLFDGSTRNLSLSDLFMTVASRHPVVEHPRSIYKVMRYRAQQKRRQRGLLLLRYSYQEWGDEYREVLLRTHIPVGALYGIQYIKESLKQ